MNEEKKNKREGGREGGNSLWLPKTTNTYNALPHLSTIFATNGGTLGPKIMQRSILPILYCQIRSEKGGGSVTKRIQSERS